MLGLALALGVWLGSGLMNPFSNGNSESDWNRVEQILQYVENEYVDTVSREDLEHEIVAYLLQRLDPHSRYISDEDFELANEPLQGGFEGIGVQFNLRNDTIYVVNTVPNGPAEVAGIHPGDLIVSVDSKMVAGTDLTNKSVTHLLKGPAGSTVKVGVKRGTGAEMIEFEITRSTIPINSLDAAYLINDSTIYVKIAQFSRTTFDEFRSMAYPLLNDRITGLVLDLRGNGGGFLDAAVAIADEFLVEDQLITYTEGKSRPRREYRSTSDGNFETVNLAVIIDGLSASASEIVAGAMQDLNRGVIVGKRSYGKGLVQEQNLWGDGSATRLTVARYYTPHGRSIQRPYESINNANIAIDSSSGGILPDLEVSRDTAGITWLYAELVHSAYLNRFAYAFRDERIDTLMHLNLEEFMTLVNDEVLEASLRAFLNSQGYEVNEQEWNRSSGLILNRIKAIIVRSLYGSEAYFELINSNDPYVKSAVDALDRHKAKKS